MQMYQYSHIQYQEQGVGGWNKGLLFNFLIYKNTWRIKMMRCLFLK